MTDWNTQTEIGELATDWLRSRSVVIGIGSNQIEQVGSGFVVSLGGRSFLGTAAHVFRDLVVEATYGGGDVTVFSGSTPRPTRLPPMAWELAPTADKLESSMLPTQDLAWAELDSDIPANFGLIGASVNELAPGISLQHDQLYAAVGSPWAGITSMTSESTLVDLQGWPVVNHEATLRLVVHFTNPSDQPSEGLGQHVVAYGQQVQTSSGHFAESLPPHGMSGGGLWEIQPIDDSGSKTVRCRLVGLIRAKLGQRLLVIPIEHWLRALVESRPELLEHLPGARSISHRRLRTGASRS